MSDILKEAEQLLNKANAGSQSTDSVRVVGERGVASFFETSPENSFAKAMRGTPWYRPRNGQVTLPKGYQRSNFESFSDFLRKGMKSQELFQKSYRPAYESFAKSLPINTTQFDDGGVLVLPEFAPEILAMLYQSESLWQRTRQYTVAGNSMSFPRLRDTNRTDGHRHGGVQAYWLGEGGTATETRPAFDQTDIKLQKLVVAVFLTEEMVSDSGYAIEQFVTEVVQAEIDYQLDKALIRGNGVGKPLGILSSGARVTVSKEGGQAANTVVAENVLNMWGRRLTGGAGDDLVWLVNQDVETLLPKMYLATGSNSGQLTYMPPGAFAERPYATLQGRPVIPSEHCSALSSEGDIMLVNFKDYLSINKGVLNQLSSPHVAFLQDMNCLKFTFRISGRPMYDTPVTVENSANQRSAFITLQAR